MISLVELDLSYNFLKSLDASKSVVFNSIVPKTLQIVLNPLSYVIGFVKDKTNTEPYDKQLFQYLSNLEVLSINNNTITTLDGVLLPESLKELYLGDDVMTNVPSKYLKIHKV